MVGHAISNLWSSLSETPSMALRALGLRGARRFFFFFLSSSLDGLGADAGAFPLYCDEPVCCWLEWDGAGPLSLTAEVFCATCTVCFFGGGTDVLSR